MISSGSDGDTRIDGNTPQGDCGRYAALLTAYFDGEATAEEACAARSHLDMCTRCARAWTAWGRARRLLHALPVPATPPNLLARIVFACRISVLPRKTVRPSALTAPEYSKASQFDRHTLSELPLISMHESALSDSSYEAPVIMPGDLPPVVPPAHLHDAILRLTIGADGQKLNKMEREEFRVPEQALAAPVFEEPIFVAPIIEEVRPQQPVRSSVSELATGRARSLARRTGRMATAFAVPAVAAWLMFASDFTTRVMPPASINQDSATVPTTQERSATAASFSAGNRLSFLQRYVEQGKKQIKNMVPPRPAMRAATAASPIAPKAEVKVAALPSTNSATLPATAMTVSLPQTNVYTPKIDWQPADFRPDFQTTPQSSLLTAPSLPPATAKTPTIRSGKLIRPVARAEERRVMSARASRIRSLEPPSNLASPRAQYAMQMSTSLRPTRAQFVASRPPSEASGAASSESSSSSSANGVTFARLDTAEALAEFHSFSEIRPEQVSDAMNGYLAELAGDM